MAGLLDPAQITPDYRIAPEALLGNWTGTDERLFQRGIRATPWFQQFVKTYGEEPDLNSQDYNYRAAWKARVRPELYQYDNTYHWPSTTPNGQSLKAKNHPTAWMEDFMQITGRDPHEAGTLNPEQVQAIQKALMFRYGGLLAP